MQTDPVDCLFSLLASVTFSTCAWDAASTNAWVYGIVVGWDEEALATLAVKFKWDTWTVALLQRYHSEFITLYSAYHLIDTPTYLHE